MFIVGTIIGIKFMVSSAEDKAKVKEALVPYVVGCVVIFGAFTIWSIAVNIGQDISPTPLNNDDRERQQLIITIKFNDHAQEFYGVPSEMPMLVVVYSSVEEYDAVMEKMEQYKASWINCTITLWNYKGADKTEMNFDEFISSGIKDEIREWFKMYYKENN